MEISPKALLDLPLDCLGLIVEWLPPGDLVRFMRASRLCRIVGDRQLSSDQYGRAFLKGLVRQLLQVKALHNEAAAGGAASPIYWLPDGRAACSATPDGELWLSWGGPPDTGEYSWLSSWEEDQFGLSGELWRWRLSPAHRGFPPKAPAALPDWRCLSRLPRKDIIWSGYRLGMHALSCWRVWKCYCPAIELEVYDAAVRCLNWCASFERDSAPRRPRSELISLVSLVDRVLPGPRLCRLVGTEVTPGVLPSGLLPYGRGDFYRQLNSAEFKTSWASGDMLASMSLMAMNNQVLFKGECYDFQEVVVNHIWQLINEEGVTEDRLVRIYCIWWHHVVFCANNHAETARWWCNIPAERIPQSPWLAQLGVWGWSEEDWSFHMNLPSAT